MGNIYQINNCAGNTLFDKDRLIRNYMPSLGQTHAKLYTLFGTKRTKTIPCPAAHPCIGLIHVREYTLGAFNSGRQEFTTLCYPYSTLLLHNGNTVNLCLAVTPLL